MSENQASVADLEKRPDTVSKMFDAVAKRYDLTNDVLTCGQDRIWRIAMRRAVNAKSSERVLDVAAGTGTSAVEYTREGAEVVAADFSEGMIEIGRQRHPELEFVKADALNLPFPDNSFDVVTISFGIRNVADVDQALREMYRVTRPGGRLVIAEFSTPTNVYFQAAYQLVLDQVLPRIARVVSSHQAAYGYLAESISAWPQQRRFAQQIEQAGWDDVEWKNLTGGIVAIHRAYKLKDSITD